MRRPAAHCQAVRLHGVIVTVLIRLAVLIALVVSCGTSPTVAPQDPVAVRVSPDWMELPDFDELRLSYGERDDLMEACERDRPLREAFEALEARDWQTVIQLSDSWLARCMVDIDFHHLRAVALAELERTSESAQQLRWRDGLVDSVLRSGDGKTAETAWIVISVREEYSILREFGMQRKSQALTRERLDKIEAELDGEIVTLFFNPEAHFRRLERRRGVTR